MKLKTLAIMGFCLAALNVCAQTSQTSNDATNVAAAMMPPNPVVNKVYDAMVGTWVGDSEMMGMKMHQRVNIHWALNHQFLIMDMTATQVGNPKMNFEGMGIFGIDAQVKAKTWWFDSWGADSMTTGTGEFQDNKLVMQDSNAMFKETRTFEVNGNEMVMTAEGTMSWQGKETPFKETTVFKKR